MVVDDNIFSSPTGQWQNETMRNITWGSWDTGTWATIDAVLANNEVRLTPQVDWNIGERVSIIPSVAGVSCTPASHTCDVTFNCSIFTTPFSGWEDDAILKNHSNGGWEYKEWGVINNVASGGGSSQVVTIEIDDSVARIARDRICNTQPPLFVPEPQQIELGGNFT